MKQLNETVVTVLLLKETKSENRNHVIVLNLFVSSDISEEWAQRWTGDFNLHPELHLPAENKFIGQYKLNVDATVHFDEVIPGKMCH